MSLPQYETTIVLDSFLKEDDRKNVLTKIENFIKNHGGEIEEIDEWGKKRLAYEINRKQYGVYVNVLFSGPSNLPKLLEREFRLEESILRYLILKVDKALRELRRMKKEEQAAQKAERTARVAAPAAPTASAESSETEPAADKSEPATTAETAAGASETETAVAEAAAEPAAEERKE